MGRGRPITLSDDDLLEAAQSVFREQGLDATAAEVARRASISESVIFHRFGTKETLLFAVLDRQMNPPRELESLSERAGQGDVAENLHRAGLLIIDKMREALPFFMMAMSSPMKMSRLNGWVRQVHPRYVRPLREYFEAESRLDRLQPLDPEILAYAFFGGIREYVFMELFASDARHVPLVEAGYVRSLVEILLHGVVRSSPGGLE